MAATRSRTLAVLAVALLVIVLGTRLLARSPSAQATVLQWPPRAASASDAVCHTVRLTLAQVEKAQEEGYAIDTQHRCITRAAHAEHARQQQQWLQARERRAAEERKQALERRLQAELEQALAQSGASATTAQPNLAQARAGRVTRVQEALAPAARTAVTPLPQPPAALFIPMSYQSQGMTLAAFASPDPGDGQRHPVMVWLTGGDSNTLDNFWHEGSAQNDQSASAFRKAGMVMVFPTLRGGNTNPGAREYFWGEVDDVVAAIAQAARLPYADPQRIYLGGHSTGGTLALLTATTGVALRGVFAFGPVAEVTDYPLPVRWPQLDAQERRLRSPLYWLHAIAAPTWIIEGAQAPGNRRSLETLCAAPRSGQVHCALMAGLDHFSVLQPSTRTLAAQLVMGQEPYLVSSQPESGKHAVRR